MKFAHKHSEPALGEQLASIRLKQSICFKFEQLGEFVYSNLEVKYKQAAWKKLKKMLRAP